MLFARIKKLAAERGLSIARLERLAGLGNGVINRWDDGANIKSLVKVAKVLDITLDELIEEVY